MGTSAWVLATAEPASRLAYRTPPGFCGLGRGDLPWSARCSPAYNRVSGIRTGRATGAAGVLGPDRRSHGMCDRVTIARMIPQPPPGQGPIDPREAFAPPPPPGTIGAPQGFQTAPPAGSFMPQPMQSNGGPSGVPAGGPPPGSMPPSMMFPAGGPPPQFYGPPMPMPMMPPPGIFRPQKSFARIIFTTLASIIFGISLTLNIYLLAFSGLSGGLGLSSRAGIIQSVEVQGDPQEKIALVPIAEPIWEPTARKFDAMMDTLEADQTVRAVVLSIETPGGTVTASDEIYDRIKKFKQKMQSAGRNVPVVVSMGAVAV